MSSYPKLYDFIDGEYVRDYDFGFGHGTEDEADRYCSRCNKVVRNIETHECQNRSIPRKMYTIQDLPDSIDYAMVEDEREMHGISSLEIHGMTQSAVLISGVVENNEFSEEWFPASQLKLSKSNDLLLSDWLFTKRFIE